MQSLSRSRDLAVSLCDADMIAKTGCCVVAMVSKFSIASGKKNEGEIGVIGNQRALGGFSIGHLAPPGVMTHTAYLTLENSGNQPRSLIGVSAKDYGMAHLHQSKTHDGIVAMSMVHQLDIASGQTVALKPESFHIMLMHPKGKPAAGDIVPRTFLTVKRS